MYSYTEMQLTPNVVEKVVSSPIGYFNVQSCMFITFQSTCSTHDSVLNSQSDCDLMLYIHYWKLPIPKKIFPMLTCPI